MHKDRPLQKIQDDVIPQPRPKHVRSRLTRLFDALKRFVALNQRYMYAPSFLYLTTRIKPKIEFL